MAPLIRECTIQASPSTIWNTCIAPMKWEEWDPDVDHLEDVSGDCVDGTTLVFVMKPGSISKIPVQLFGVIENQCIHYHGHVLGGMMKFNASIEISTTTTTSTSISRVKYMFDMHGILGSFVHWYNPVPVTNGVEKGLENIKNLSEAATNITPH